MIFSFILFTTRSMTIQEITLPPITPGAKIKVVWVWWGGNKALNRIIQQWIDWVEFVAVNTDAQDLAANLSWTKVNIWINITKWLWAWANPEIWRKSAEESENEVKQALSDADMVFITAWMWWGTWTWAAPVIAGIAKSMWILTIGIVTKPFSFEWKKREANAEEWLVKMKENVDTLIVIPNDKIFNVADKKTTFAQAFQMIDKVLYLGIQWISDLITKPWDINIDFADIKEIMLNSGNALLGIGYGAGEKRAVDAARQAIENPLLETNLDGAKKVIFAVSGWADLTPMEVQDAAQVVQEILDPEANMIWGMSFDDSFEDEVKVTIIATWFTEQAKTKWPRRVITDNLGRPISRDRNSENFVIRGVKQWQDQNDSSSKWFTAHIIDDGNEPIKPITNDWFRSPDNTNEDWETPAFIKRQLSNDSDNKDS